MFLEITRVYICSDAVEKEFWKFKKWRKIHIHSFVITWLEGTDWLWILNNQSTIENMSSMRRKDSWVVAEFLWHELDRPCLVCPFQLSSEMESVIKKF